MRRRPDGQTAKMQVFAVIRVIGGIWKYVRTDCLIRAPAGISWLRVLHRIL